MGWNFRRSIRLGPFRFNLSKSGVGASAGIPGLRVGRDAKGRNYSQVSIPGTGIYRRDYYKTQQTTNTVPSNPGTLKAPNQNPGSSPSTTGSSMSQGTKYVIFLSAIAAVVWFVLQVVLH